MISGKPFDLNVVVIGNVSAGKSTLLNALLRAKYSEVSMKRTTAGINYFRLHTATENENEPGPKQGNQEKVLGECELDVPLCEWVKAVDNPRTAASTLQEISDDNARLRTNNDLQEKYFDVELAECFCPVIHPGVRLVLVDIPGINEADTGGKYKEYLASKWRTFDCVIVVMDGKQGVNTGDQVNLLKFVEANQSMRWQPVIILCNKIDDPDDEEQNELVTEARKEVERIFNVSDRDEAIIDLLNSEGSVTKPLLPAFLPFSASHAYFYQAASLLSLEEFQQYDDRALVDKYGKEYVGRAKWSCLTRDQKIEAVYGVVTDPDMRHTGLEISSFDRLLKVINRCIGDPNTQIDLVADKMNLCLPFANVVDTAWVADLYQSYKFLVDCRQSEKILSKGVDLIVKKLESFLDTLSEDPRVMTEQLMEMYHAYQFLAESQANDLIMSRAVGLIVDRLNAALACVLMGSRSIAEQFVTLHKSYPFVAAARDPAILSAAEAAIAMHFWEHLHGAQEQAVSAITKSPQAVDCLSPVISEILAYHSFVKILSPSQAVQEESTIEKTMRDLIRAYIRALISQASKYQPESAAAGEKEGILSRVNSARRMKSPRGNKGWIHVRPEDWVKIWGSVLLAASNQHFYEAFGKEKLEIDDFLHNARMLPKSQQGAVSVGRTRFRISVPESLSDPSHFGHVIWRYCNFMSYKASLKPMSVELI
jgi:small GTP-binding protein